ncbi:MAG: DNA topoisomerase I, partial [Leptolyngbyaceae cyanobacterium CRU_2_3]|nr:DNA topoisomerase I [Leptolyngbyaceae cyanobacterium CRU_2_3]
VTLEMAVSLLALPRLLGAHPETGAKIQANLGRFGPYVVHDQGKDGKDYRSLKKEDDILTISLERALELLNEPKAGRRSKTAAPLRELGVHPEDGEPVTICNGPYGPYIKHGKVNASLPEGETAEKISMEVAVQALTEKAGAKKKGGRSTSKSTASKSTNSTAAKKTTAEKTTKTATKTTKTAKSAKSTTGSTRKSTKSDQS